MSYRITNEVFIHTPFGASGDERFATLLGSLGISTQAEWEAWVDAATQDQLNTATRSLLKMFVRFEQTL